MKWQRYNNYSNIIASQGIYGRLGGGLLSSSLDCINQVEQLGSLFYQNPTWNGWDIAKNINNSNIKY